MNIDKGVVNHLGKNFLCCLEWFATFPNCIGLIVCFFCRKCTKKINKTSLLKVPFFVAFNLQS